MKQIFVSYSRKDRDAVATLVTALKQSTPNIFIDDQIRIENWRERLDKEIRHCDALLVVWSNTANKSAEVHKELDAAQALNKPIVQCFIEKCDIPADYADQNAANLTNFGGRWHDQTWLNILDALGLPHPPKSNLLSVSKSQLQDPERFHQQSHMFSDEKTLTKCVKQYLREGFIIIKIDDGAVYLRKSVRSKKLKTRLVQLLCKLPMNEAVKKSLQLTTRDEIAICNLI